MYCEGAYFCVFKGTEQIEDKENLLNHLYQSEDRVLSSDWLTFVIE